MRFWRRLVGPRHPVDETMAKREAEARLAYLRRKVAANEQIVNMRRNV